MTPDEEYIDKLIIKIRKLACVCFGIPKENIHIQISPSTAAGSWHALVSREHVLVVKTERGAAQNAEGKTLHDALRNLSDALIEAAYKRWQERYEERLQEIEITRTEVQPEDDFDVSDEDRR